MNEQKTIIGLIGERYAGKSNFASFLSDVTKQRVEIIKLSQFIADEAIRNGLKPSRDNLATTLSQMQEEKGEDILESLAFQAAFSTAAETVVLDGVRRQRTIDLLRQVPGSLMVAIYASGPIRHWRYLLLGEEKDQFQTNLDAFLLHDNLGNEMGIRDRMKQADYWLINETQNPFQYKYQIQQFWNWYSSLKSVK